MPALVVHHGAHTAYRRAGNDDIALAERAVLHEDSHNRAAAFVEAGFDDGALRGAVRIGLELLDLGENREVFQQVVNAHTGFGRDRADNGIAAPLLRNQVVLRELLLDALGVGPGDVHLIDGHHDGDIGSLGMVDALYGLGHNAVIRGNDQNGDVGDHGTAGTHGGECLVARRIQEGDGLAVNLHGVGADGLGDAAGLTGGNVGFADIVQKGGFAVVYMAHHHNNGCSGDEIFRAVLMVVNEALLHGDDDFLLHLAAQLHCHQCCGVIIDDVGDGDKGAHLHKGFDHFSGCLLHS